MKKSELKAVIRSIIRESSNKVHPKMRQIKKAAIEYGDLIAFNKQANNDFHKNTSKGAKKAHFHGQEFKDEFDDELEHETEVHDTLLSLIGGSVHAFTWLNIANDPVFGFDTWEHARFKNKQDPKSFDKFMAACNYLMTTGNEPNPDDWKSNEWKQWTV